MVERFFAEITRKRIRRGVFKSVDELKQAIMDYLDEHNGEPKPYVWTKTAAEIFTSLKSPVRNKRWNHNTRFVRAGARQSARRVPRLGQRRAVPSPQSLGRRLARQLVLPRCSGGLRRLILGTVPLDFRTLPSNF
jgi:hypothetical protein